MMLMGGSSPKRTTMWTNIYGIAKDLVTASELKATSNIFPFAGFPCSGGYRDAYKSDQGEEHACQNNEWLDS